MKLKILLILIFPAFFFSCMAPPKNIVYFQDLDEYPQSINSTPYKEPVIKNKDELLITVSALALNQEKVAQFNLPAVGYMSSTETKTQTNPSLQTYIVDTEGKIKFPVIGEITLAGLTRSQAIEHLKNLISNYIDDPIINLRFTSFNIVIFGEVRSPGTLYFNRDKISILDAVGAAGDLTLYGDRKNILLIRENSDGTIERTRFDLTSSDLFSSPYYYLQQNDKIFVEPNKTRQSDSKYGAADGYKLSIFSMAFGAISVIASTTLAIISLRKN
jgi:polysaccharide export outer membrane protein